MGKTLNQAPSGIAVDIDETIANTVELLMQEMQQRFGNPEGRSAQELVQLHQKAGRVPYPEWQTPEAKTWLKEAVHSEDVHRRAPEITGARETLTRLHEKGLLSCYLTVRDSSLTNVTKEWLELNGFPILDIITKPDYVKNRHGDAWKALELHQNHPHITGIIDNSASVMTNLPGNYAGQAYHFGAEAPVRTDIKITPCNNWSKVEMAIQKERNIPLNP